MLLPLKQPYPYLHKGRNLIKVTLLILIIGFLFEYFIIPFQRTPDEHLYPYAIISLYHVGVAALVYFLFYWMVSLWADEEEWKVYKELSSMAVLLFFIGLGEWAIRDLIYDHPNNWQLRLMVEEVRHAYLSGSVVIILVLTFNYNFLVRKNLTQLVEMRLPSHRPSAASSMLLMETQTKSDDFELDLALLLCIRADGNYAEFYIRAGDEIQKLIKRLTIQRASEQLAAYPHFVKTHRAFIINSHVVGKVEGNAQGFQVTIEGVPFTIPVSRKHIAAFNKAAHQH
jgi:hypothetical protein